MQMAYIQEENESVYMLINVLKSFACNFIPVLTKYILVFGFQSFVVHLPFTIHCPMEFHSIISSHQFIFLSLFFCCHIFFLASIMKISSKNKIL